MKVGNKESTQQDFENQFENWVPNIDDEVNPK
jgi:hypothetical protein